MTDARAPAWASWLEHNSNLLKIRSAALRVLNQRLAGGWSSWCDYLGDQAEQAALMAKLRIAAMKILDGRSAKALATWMELVAERAKMRTIVTRMVHVRMANGWSGWCTYASERNAAKREDSQGMLADWRCARAGLQLMEQVLQRLPLLTARSQPHTESSCIVGMGILGDCSVRGKRSRGDAGTRLEQILAHVSRMARLARDAIQSITPPHCRDAHTQPAALERLEQLERLR